MKFKCDSCKKNIVDVGYSLPSVVFCKECNGEEAWNCVDAGTFSCDCNFCGPQPWSDGIDQITTSDVDSAFDSIIEHPGDYPF